MSTMILFSKKGVINAKSIILSRGKVKIGISCNVKKLQRDCHYLWDTLIFQLGKRYISLRLI